MKNADFRAWMERLDLTCPEAAKLLGMSVPTIERWRRDGIAIARTTELACLYIEEVRNTTKRLSSKIRNKSPI